MNTKQFLVGLVMIMMAGAAMGQNDCYNPTMRAAKAAYDKGNYKRAEQLYREASECYDCTAQQKAQAKRKAEESRKKRVAATTTGSTTNSQQQREEELRRREERLRQREAALRREEEQAAERKRQAEERRKREEAERNRKRDNITLNVSGVEFTMVKVEGGTYTMGCTWEQGKDCFDDEKPAHSVTLSSYYIGETEVTQALWHAVMGYNPSEWVGEDLPVEHVTKHEVQVFIQQLNLLTGRKFRLPTEAEWEYAARGGSRSCGFKYSGSNNIEVVAWYEGNSGKQPHKVKGKQSNELGLYDMSGNVLEWCSEWEGSSRDVRGGSWQYGAKYCRVSHRNLYVLTDYRHDDIGFRLVLDDSPTITESQDGNVKISLKDESFTMIFVKGGHFSMGCTSEQEGDCWENEIPVHRVTLSDYYIGETEVTQSLWRKVMGDVPSYKWNDNQGICDNCPAFDITQDEVQVFIQKLNYLTGRIFRLPAEAEWEYAARGGNKSRGYKYSGSNYVEEVAWYFENSGGKIHPVKKKQANELGLYDMSGNVREMCSDRYSDFVLDEQLEQDGLSSDFDYCVCRGGSWSYGARGCRVSDRSGSGPVTRNNDLGFRLVLVP